MSVNPYTLNNLYNQGILDYVPTDIYDTGYNFNRQNMFQNNFGSMGDTFSSSNYGVNSNTMYANNGTYTSNGLYANNGTDADKSAKNGILNSMTGIFRKNRNENYGSGSNEGNSYGNIQTENFKAKFGETAKQVNSAPVFVKGLVSGAVILGTLILCFKGKKKPPQVNTGGSFFSHLKFWGKNK